MMYRDKRYLDRKIAETLEMYTKRNAQTIHHHSRFILGHRFNTVVMSLYLLGKFGDFWKIDSHLLADSDSLQPARGVMRDAANGGQPCTGETTQGAAGCFEWSVSPWSCHLQRVLELPVIKTGCTHRMM